MDNKIILAFLAVVVIVAGVFGFVMNKALDNQSSLGAEINYSTALSNANLYNSLDSLVTDLGVVTTATIQPGTGATMGPNSTATTSVTTAGAAVGDFVIVSMASSSYVEAGLFVTGQVTAASTTQVIWVNNTTSSATVATTSIRIRVLPRAIGTTATTTR